MTVKKAYENFKKLVEEGHGDIELLGFDGQGDTDFGAVGDEVEEVKDTHYFQGEILDMDVGAKYVAIYIG